MRTINAAAKPPENPTHGMYPLQVPPNNTVYRITRMNGKPSYSLFLDGAWRTRRPTVDKAYNSFVISKILNKETIYWQKC